MIYIGSDHAGFALKKKIEAYLQRKRITYVDMGPFKLHPEDDYPDYCIPVAEAVAKDKGSAGIVIGGSGEGEAIVANKVKGIRAAVVYDTFTAVKSRQHNDANVIALRGRGVSAKKSITLLALWLKTPFSNAAKHKRRIAKISRYER
jgi:ribose 5-phosphate isomerase B